MRDVFNEAEKNTKYQNNTVISDAWTSTIAMAKNLEHNISHVIHKHKKPYDKAVIKHHEYKKNRANHHRYWRENRRYEKACHPSRALHGKERITKCAYLVKNE